MRHDCGIGFGSLEKLEIVRLDRFDFLHLIIGLLSFFSVLMAASAFYHDDALISLRYAYNYLNSGELAWNVGDRVQGYTNLFHLLLVSAVAEVGVPILSAPRVVNGIGLLGLFLSFYLALKVVVPIEGGRARIAGWSALLGTVSLPIWIWGGLEPVVVAAFVTAAFTAIVPVIVGCAKRPYLLVFVSGVLIAIAILTRIDSIIIGMAIGVFLLFDSGPYSKIRIIILFSVAPAVICAALFAWQFSYYGFFLPNTFYAKSGLPFSLRLSSGYNYLLYSSFYVTAVTAFLGVIVAQVGARLYGAPGQPEETNKRDKLLCLIALVIFSEFLYVLWTGGDHMIAGRFLVPIVGVAAIGVSIVVSRLSFAAVFVAALVAFNCSYSFLNTRATNEYGMIVDVAAESGKIVGDYISENFRPGALVAVTAAGATPFFAEKQRFIDMLGLNDKYIAHRNIEEKDIRMPMQRHPGHLKGDGNYILSRKPDYIVVGPPQGVTIDTPWFLSDVELKESPEFYRCYRKDTVKINPGFYFTYYYRTCKRDRYLGYYSTANVDLFDNVKSRSLGDVYGELKLTTEGIFIHPGERESTAVEFNLDGLYHA